MICPDCGGKKYRRNTNKRMLTDNSGNPLKVYHGSDIEISQFDPERMGERDVGYYGRGFYFTNKRAGAQQYGDVKLRKLDAGKVTVANLRMDNPLKTTPSKLLKEYGPISGQNLTDAVKADGYDGLIIDMAEPGAFRLPGRTTSKEYIVFDTSQIEIVKGGRNYRRNVDRRERELERRMIQGDASQVPEPAPLRDAEHAWQKQRLIKYLFGEIQI